MSTIVKESDGNLSIVKTELAIATFEFGFREFVKSELKLLPTKKINKVTFNVLDLEQPNEFKLTRSSAPAPNGFSKIWQGAMFIEGTNTDMTAWRKD